MSIRTRLLVLLLVLAVAPMLLLGGYTLSSLDQLEDRVGSEAHDALLATEFSRLRTKIADAVVIYGRQTRALEHLVGDQAAVAERSLSEPSGGAALRYTSDFDAGRVATVGSERHARLREDGSSETMAVSFDDVALLVVTGTAPVSVTADAARLSALAPRYARLAELGDLGVLWHYTSLKSGLHSVYPGHGGYPASFDPRQRLPEPRAVRQVSPAKRRGSCAPSKGRTTSSTRGGTHDQAGERTRARISWRPTTRSSSP